MEFEYKDAKGRNIVIIVDEMDAVIVAKHKGVNVAVFQYNRIELEPPQDYNYELFSMNVIPEYQNAGIGSKIIELGEENFDNVTYPQDTGSHHGNHLSCEGKAFMDHCEKLNIIKDPDYCDEEDYNEYYYEPEENVDL